MNAAASYQHEVPGAQIVPLALDSVARLPCQQNDDLMKRMIVVFDVLPPSVRQMKQPERLPQIAPHLVLQRFHTRHLRIFCTHYITSYALRASFLQIITILKILLPFCNFCVAFLKAVWYDRMRWGIAPMEIYDTNGR